MQLVQTLKDADLHFHIFPQWKDLVRKHCQAVLKGLERKVVMLKAGTDINCYSPPHGFTPAPDSRCKVSPIINASNVSSEDDLGTAADGDCSQTLSDRFPRVAIMGDVLSSCCRTMQGFTLMQQLPLLPHPGLYTYVTHTALRAQHKLPAQALKVWKKL